MTWWDGWRCESHSSYTGTPTGCDLQQHDPASCGDCTSINTLKLQHCLRQPSMAPTKTCSDTETTQSGNGNAWVVRKRKRIKGWVGDGVLLGWDGGDGQQMTWSRYRAAAIWLLRGVKLWLFRTYLVWSAAGCEQSFWCDSFFSLFQWLCGAGTWPGPRDTYITEPWQLHIYKNTQHTQRWLQFYCHRVLLHWSPSLLKDNKGQPVKQAVSYCLLPGDIAGIRKARTNLGKFLLSFKKNPFTFWW